MYKTVITNRNKFHDLKKKVYHGKHITSLWNSFFEIFLIEKNYKCCVNILNCNFIKYAYSMNILNHIFRIILTTF